MPRTAFTTNIDARKFAQQIIRDSKTEIIACSKAAYLTPEVGFREHKTSRLIGHLLNGLGLRVEQGLAQTGIKAVIDFQKAGPRVAVLCELDAIRVPSHPGSDENTGAAHACGHHAQIGALFGVAKALAREELRSFLHGSVALIATPAEEFIDISERLELKKSGKISFLSGKQEMIKKGVFDDIDLAMLVHTSTGNGSNSIHIGGTSNAHIAHHVKFLGRSAHAGGSPEKGVNALQAAVLAMNAINTQRETLQEHDVARIHGIIVKGGSAVSAVPDEVIYEGRVRSVDVSRLEEINSQVLRCYRAGALGIGANVEIQSIPGYLPMKNNMGLQDIFGINSESILGPNSVHKSPNNESLGGSTDMGDLSNLIPSIHPYSISAIGTGHGADYLINDYDLATVIPAQIMVGSIIDLLCDDARKGNNVKVNFRPSFTKNEYIKTQSEKFQREIFGHLK